MNVLSATSAIHSLWNAVPAAVQKRLQRSDVALRPVFRPRGDSDEYADPLDGFAVCGLSRPAYNEPAFQYLLEIERRRSETAERPFLLLLIDGALPRGVRATERLFPVICRSLRETDFVGWYRQDAILGATLAQDGATGAAHASGIVRDRIIDALRCDFPSDVVPELRLRLYQVLGDDVMRIE